METITYEEVTPTLIENTTMLKIFGDGVHRQYRITPNDGYVLHNSFRDWTYIDPETMKETFCRGYSAGYSTCAASYDFEKNPHEFYAVPADSVPAQQIF